MKKLLLTFTAILASIAHAADSPKETAQTFFHELFAGDADKAAELIYIPPEGGDKGAEMAKGKITMMASEMQAQIKKEGSIDVSTGEVTYTNADKTEATVKVTLTGKKNGKEHSETNTVSLIKTDKGWRIKM